MRRTLIACALMLAIGSAAAFPARAERVALVIGNGAYVHIPFLANPVNDARGIADTLRSIGFAVLEASDLDRNGMEQAIRQFGTRARDAEAALFFYAGHGLQYADENYLLPVGATADEPSDLRYEAVPLDLVMAEIDEAEADVSLIILDACRDNPLVARLSGASRSSDDGRGLAAVRGATGTLIAYATAPGEIAQDGDGPHSPFTSALLQWLPQPGLEVGIMFRRVRESVIEATNGAQVPWVEESILGEFYFVPLPAEPTGAAVQPVADNRAEIVFWETVADSRDAADFEAYLRQFPSGVFADLARNRIAQIRGGAPGAAPTGASAGSAAAPQVDLTWDVGDQQWVPAALRLLDYPVASGASLTSTDVMAAIRDFQDGLGTDETGQLTADERVALATAAAEAAGLRAEDAAERARDRAEDAREADNGGVTFQYGDRERFQDFATNPIDAAAALRVMEWQLDSGNASIRYEGEFSNGQIQGHGVAYRPDGSRYEGQFAASAGNGYGVRIGPDGSRLSGQWNNDVFEGFGVSEDADGRLWIGAWRDGGPNGYGTYLHPNGFYDRGLWQEGTLIERHLTEPVSVPRMPEPDERRSIFSLEDDRQWSR